MITTKQTLVLVVMICVKMVAMHSVIGLNEIGKSASYVPPITQLSIGKDQFSIKTSTETTRTTMRLPVPNQRIVVPVLIMSSDAGV